MDLMPRDFAIPRDEITASRLAATRSEIRLGSSSMTLLETLAVAKVQDALPRSLPRESVDSEIKLTTKI